MPSDLLVLLGLVVLAAAGYAIIKRVRAQNAQIQPEPDVTPEELERLLDAAPEPRARPTGTAEASAHAVQAMQAQRAPEPKLVYSSARPAAPKPATPKRPSARRVQDSRPPEPTPTYDDSPVLGVATIFDTTPPRHEPVSYTPEPTPVHHTPVHHSPVHHDPSPSHHVDHSPSYHSTDHSSSYHSDTSSSGGYDSGGGGYDGGSGGGGGFD